MSEDLLQRKMSKLAEMMKQENDEIHSSTYENLESYREDAPFPQPGRPNKSQITFSKTPDLGKISIAETTNSRQQHHSAKLD